LWREVPRLDLAFEVHDKQVCVDTNLWDVTKTCPVPVYMLRQYSDVENWRQYPLRAVREMFTIEPRTKPFLVSTPAYMLAFALLSQPALREIHLFGVDMTIDSEYEIQRPSCEFFLGVAHGRGIRVVLTEQSDLLKTRFLYGYDERDRAAEVGDLRERLLTFRQRHEAAADAELAAHDKRLKLEGVILDTDYALKRAKL